MSYSEIPPDLLDTITTGDARELAARIPDGSVDLVFTDPVYDRIDDYRWLAETAARVLKPGGSALAFVDPPNLPGAIDAMRLGGLSYRWLIVWYRNNEIRQRGAPPGKNCYTPCLLFDRGDGKRAGFAYDLHSVPVMAATDEAARHAWLKPRRLIRMMVANYAHPGAIVYDPFTGGGTVPAVCKMLGRHYIASEIDPATAELARARVFNTQPPLFVAEPEQSRMELEIAV